MRQGYAISHFEIYYVGCVFFNDVTDACCVRKQRDSPGFLRDPHSTGGEALLAGAASLIALSCSEIKIRRVSGGDWANL